ncbi:hypothetical protein [Halocynthiibacter sp.]|uniref:hypothetical protein n=1 Tax=Halocynthiibacter sp. TaxID=1979210 RepID=UPI003C615414
MQPTGSSGLQADRALAPHVRAYLCSLSCHETPVTYQALTKALQLSPPNTIRQLTMALECLIEEDAATGHPLIAALVISKTRGGLPAPGFFDSAERAGRHHEDPREFHAREFENAVKFWCRTSTPEEND